MWYLGILSFLMGSWKFWEEYDMLPPPRMTVEEAIRSHWNSLPCKGWDDSAVPDKGEILRFQKGCEFGLLGARRDQNLLKLMDTFSVRWDRSKRDNAKISRLQGCWINYGVHEDLFGDDLIIECQQPISGENVGEGKFCYAAVRGRWPTPETPENEDIEVYPPDVPFRYFLNEAAPDGMELVDSGDERFWSDWTEVDGFLELIADKRLIWYTTARCRPTYDAALRKVLGKKLAI